MTFGTATGKTEIAPKTWHHVVLSGDRVYLDGASEIEGKSEPGGPLFLGGRADGAANFEGRIDEAAIYDRVLTAEEIAAHFKAASP